MTGVDFDAFTRALATGKSRRQALRGLFSTAFGVGLFGSSMGVAEAAPTKELGRADIARHSAQLLSRMPDPAKLRNRDLPIAVRSAIHTDHRLLSAGLQAQTWSDSQLEDFQRQVSASIRRHQILATTLQPRTFQPPTTALSSAAEVTPSAPANAACYVQCTTNFLTSIGGCSAGLGGLLCELLALVAFDLCVVGCILGGIGL
jgi:hypothetical protein